MSIKDSIIQSQLLPPSQRASILLRPRLQALLASVYDYPLTIVQAGTGYGKSTALAELASSSRGLFWYSISEPERDPLLFLANLISAFNQGGKNLGMTALQALEDSGLQVSINALTPLVNTLTVNLTEDTLFVLDDFHIVADIPEITTLVEWLVDYRPPRLHLILATRQMPSLSAFNRWRVKGQVQLFGRAELAFTAVEIEQLFKEKYRRPISTEQAQVLAAETEGWVVALQMVWQNLQVQPSTNLDEVLNRLPESLEALFEYLAHEVLARQPKHIQRFLLQTSVLRQMSGDLCDAVLNMQGSSSILRQLDERGLFLAQVNPETYRYQRLFHDFLQSQLNADSTQTRLLHKRAATYFIGKELFEEALYHLYKSEEFNQAAAILARVGDKMIQGGRLESLSYWIQRLPESMQRVHPQLSVLLGDVYRLRADFDEALEVYSAAQHCFEDQGNHLGQSRALRGQAQVYLDTLRPFKADSLLGQALRLLEPQEYRAEVADMLEQLAENKLNLGHPDEARAIHHEARLLRAESDPGDVYLEARSLLRTGRLAEGRQLLEAHLEESSDQPARPPRFHREITLLLSLICLMQGDIQAGEQYARQGIAIGRQLNSIFVEAVGYMRLGHAMQMEQSAPWRAWKHQKALEYYHKAIELARVFKVMRIQVEPLWGLARLYGFQGSLNQAELYAYQAIEIAQTSGDPWFVGLIQTTLGASLALAGEGARARQVLTSAAQGFEAVGDSYSGCAALLWLGLNAWWQGEADEAMQFMPDLLSTCRANGLDDLLIQCSHLGLKDRQAVIPLLIEAQKRGIESGYVKKLLQGCGFSGIDYHPGYTLVVRTLGFGEIYRGSIPITAHEWQREKARQLFQLLITFRGKWLQRDQIIERLWPRSDLDSAINSFKVALNALNRALEPNRPAGCAPFFIIRRDNLYELNPQASLELDCEEFDHLANSNDMEHLKQALDIYQEDYLPGCLDEDWPALERERLRKLYLITAEKLARHSAAQETWDEVLQFAQAILERDNCNENAYQFQMQAYAALNNRTMVHETFRRCTNTLANELEIEPSQATQELYQQLS